MNANGGIRTHDLSRREAQTCALDRAATGTGLSDISDFNFLIPSFLYCIDPTIKAANNRFELTVSTVTPQRTSVVAVI